MNQLDIFEAIYCLLLAEALLLCIYTRLKTMKSTEAACQYHPHSHVTFSRSGRGRTPSRQILLPFPCVHGAYERLLLIRGP